MKEQFMKNKKMILIYIGIPLVLNLVIDILGHKSIWGGIKHSFTNPIVFLANTLIIFFTLSLTLLTRRRVFCVSLVSVLWLTLGCVNFFLLVNRVTPFTAMDFLNIDSALGVIDKYFNVFTYLLMFAAIGGVLTGLVFAFFKAPQVAGTMHYGKDLTVIALAGVLLAAVVFIGNVTGALSFKFPELSQAYRQYGFVYCFSNSVFNSGVSKPTNYSETQISKLTNEEETGEEVTKKQEEEPDLSQVKTPNIVIVQLESFFDITRCRDLEFSEDPLPNLHKYTKKSASGLLSMPVVGAGTVNSEFEILTGLDIDFFGPGEYPFKTTLKTQTCESLAFNLADYGYVSHCIHNNTGAFYGRNVVLANLGFHDFTPVEYMNLKRDTDYTPMGWAKDRVLTPYMKEALDSTKGTDFLYTISVQGHGSYPTSGEYDLPIKVTAKDGFDLDEGILNGREYYTNQIHEMDQFIGDVIDMVKERNEESIVVFYGDHLPSLNFSEAEFDKGTIYDTDYFIWENLDDVKYQNQDMEAFEMESTLLKPLGITNGMVNKYHQDNKDTEEYLNGLQNLQYDIFGGEMLAYGGVNPYKATDLQMGIKEIRITEIYMQTPENAPTETTPKESEEETVKGDVDNIEEATDEKETKPGPDAEGYVIIKGRNFTRYSKVFVNGEYFGDTEFIDTSTLRIYYPELRGLDSFVVSQTHSADAPLSSTKEMLYYGEGYVKDTTTVQETTKTKDSKDPKSRTTTVKEEVDTTATEKKK